MLNRKIAISLTLIGLFAANVAFALPEFDTEAPQRSIDACITEVDTNADFTNAASILHNVHTSDRQVSGHKLRIQTLVYGDDGETVIREYAAICAINGQAQIKRFKIRQRDSVTTNGR